MSTVLTKDLLDQYQRAIAMLGATIRKFDRQQWMQGISVFQAPAKVAYHTVECLDAYFREDPDADYRWGHRFGAPFWKLADEEQPSLVAEYVDFLKNNKKWWLTPIILALLLLGILVVLGGSSAAPFIYTLF